MNWERFPVSRPRGMASWVKGQGSGVKGRRSAQDVPKGGSRGPSHGVSASVAGTQELAPAGFATYPRERGWLVAVGMCDSSTFREEGTPPRGTLCGSPCAGVPGGLPGSHPGLLQAGRRAQTCFSPGRGHPARRPLHKRKMSRVTGCHRAAQRLEGGRGSRSARVRPAGLLPPSLPPSEAKWIFH